MLVKNVVTIEGYLPDNRTNVKQHHLQPRSESPTKAPTKAPTEALTEALTEEPTETSTEAATEGTNAETNEGITSIPITATAAARKDERKYEEKLKKV